MKHRNIGQLIVFHQDANARGPKNSSIRLL